MTKEMVSAGDYIEDAAPGTMIYAQVMTQTGSAFPIRRWETALAIREEPGRVATLAADKPVAQFRAGMFPQFGSSAIVLMARFSDSMLYETWINLDTEGGVAAFGDLGKQPTLAVMFYTPKRDRVLRFPAIELREYFKSLDIGLHFPGDFEKERKRIYGEFPTMRALWEAIT